jgi:hypothetical protein
MKPIIFSTPMVQAILDRRKTMTRRVIVPQPVKKGAFWTLGGAGWNGNSVVPVYGHSLYNRMPYKPGDALWVRETWTTPKDSGILPNWPDPEEPVYWYKADGKDCEPEYIKSIRWKPSIHMSRKAARIFLRVTDVRVERLLDITETDAMREGFEVKIKSKTVNGNVYNGSTTAREGFLLYWDDLYAYKDVPKGEIFGPKASHKNPWVWAYEFKRIAKEEAENDK